MAEPKSSPSRDSTLRSPAPRSAAIDVRGVRQNNLKGFNIQIPLRKWTVVTGLSGSGKSSLAFETLYAEGQRRYIESLSTYTRQFLEKMPRPDVEAIHHIPPSIALEQRNTVLNSRSTVATQTEIMDFLRILFARAGTTVCPDCNAPAVLMTPQHMQTLMESWIHDHPSRKFAILAPLPTSGPTAPGTKRPPSQKKTAASLESLLQMLVQQGFRRVAMRATSDTSAEQALEFLEIEDPAADAVAWSKRFGAQAERWVVLDRLKAGGSGSLDRSQKTRIHDSIQQALKISKDTVTLTTLDGDPELKTYRSGFGCSQCGRMFRPPEPALFSFNSPVGACPACSGFGHLLTLDEAKVVPDPANTLKNGAIDPLSKPSMRDWQRDLFRMAERHGISVGTRYRELTAEQKRLLWKGDGEFFGIEGCFKELERWKYRLHVRVFIRRYQTQTLCTACGGFRLQSDALNVRLGHKNLPQALDMTLSDAATWLNGLELNPTQLKTVDDVLSQIRRRLQFLNDVGVGYLQLSRLAKTLSGGEFQRINIATQLGSGLCGTLYVLDEPSIGLHPSDTDRMIGVLKRLRDQGNTLVVVEHDLEVIRSADHVVELGPGAGSRGGSLLAEGPTEKVLGTGDTLTAQYARRELTLKRPLRERGRATKAIRITGCREHNLKNLDLTVPLERLVVFTGPSGSGKSTLVTSTLVPALLRESPVGAFKNLYGQEHITQTVLLDQKPIGRSSRSNAATYMKIWDEVRRLYATTALARRRSYTPQTFSFNVDGGRCATCRGDGEVTFDMHFMADVTVPCEDCQGKRFKKSVLEVVVRGKNLDQLLHTTIDEAYDLYRDHPVLSKKLNTLRDVGLGYLQLGQSGSSLSGGESQRLKIASVLDPTSGLGRVGKVLYVLDEPTTGLHMEDVRKLMTVLHDLVEARHSVWLIEHHVDVMAQADWIVDLGPGAGPDGGAIVAEGTPETIAAQAHVSATGRALQPYFPNSLRGDS